MRIPAVLGPVVLLGLALVPRAHAHEVRPAYLEIVRVGDARYEVSFKQPVLAGRVLALDPELPDDCEATEQIAERGLSRSMARSWDVQCEAELVGREIGVSGLERTLTDVLVRIDFTAEGLSPIDGGGPGVVTRVLRPAEPRFTVERTTSVGVWAYLRMGVDHLIFGFDHILFVIGLLFLVPTALELVQVVTAFTVAHSITLALSSLGHVRLPQSPVEAVIAASILLLAVELVSARQREREGLPARDTWTFRYPWVVAFGFGLLHGFGFAGALAEIGLPDGAAALALLLFNLGVEVGQLLIVSGVLGLAWVLRRLRVEVPAGWTEAPIWGMGAIAAFWLIERVVA